MNWARRAYRTSAERCCLWFIRTFGWNRGFSPIYWWQADEVIVELKSVERFSPVHDAQLLTYLRMTGYRVGLLVNFNMLRLKDGLRRLVM
jgi:hypothetical protein